MKRYLDTIEEPFMALGQEAMLTVEYRGRLDHHALKESFNELCNEHPMLRSQIRLDRQRYLLEVIQDSNPAPVHVVSGGLDDLHSYVGDTSTEALIARKETGVLRDVTARIIVAEQADRGYVVLAIHHALVDGISAFEIQRKLWRIYTDVVNGSQNSITHAQKLPKPPTEILRSHWPNAEKSIEEQDHIYSPRYIGEGIGKLVKLSVSETNQFLDSAKSRGVSVASLVIGEIISELPTADLIAGPNKVIIGNVVGLRHHLRPQVGATETTYLCGEFAAAVRISADAATIGREMTEQLESALKHHRVPIRGYSVKDSDLGILLNTDLIFNNAGAIPEFNTPDDLDLVDWFELHTTERAVTKFQEPPLLSCVCYTYRGEMRFLFATMLTRKSMIDQIEKRIRSK